ncbi:MAG: hypothetical protein HYT22_01070 [Candidatus Niyogibacteria bacterium]|nr:hypothetical protein [Candidatus Niyogibacteria bacterium]
MFLKWLVYSGVSFIGLFAFQWMLYTGTELSKTRVLFGYVFPSQYFFWFAWAAVMGIVLIIPNSVSFYVIGLAYNEWFKKVWILSLTVFATSAISTFLVAWLKFSEVPSKGSLVGLGFIIAGSLISVFWR